MPFEDFARVKHSWKGLLMTVKRIVTNLAADKPESAAAFYRDILGLELLMDHGWIQTYGNAETMTAQVSIASEGGLRYTGS